jgi:ferredoxin/flavodoxin---NADP+ reductase
MDPLMQEKLTGNDVLTGFNEITHIRFLTESTFVLRFNREKLQFKAGQRIIVGVKGDPDQREYSVYSGENDDYLEIMVKEVRDGNLSVKLKHCIPGQFLQVNGPFGSFGSENYDRHSRKLVFIATGTGISPFHSIIRSSPAINYTLIHGVRFRNEAYERNEYEASRYILCTSKESTVGFKGRVTKFLLDYRVTPDMLFYLCGNGNMIYEVYHILRNKGVPSEKIFSEIYF